MLPIVTFADVRPDRNCARLKTRRLGHGNTLLRSFIAALATARVVHRDVIAGFCEFDGNSPTDATRGPGHQCHWIRRHIENQLPRCFSGSSVSTQLKKPRMR